MSASLERLRTLLRRRPLLADVALTVFLLLPLLPPRVGDLKTSADARLFSVALILPLLARRRRPVAVFGVIAVIAVGQWLADVRAFGDVALLVALYGVAVSQPVRVAAAAWLAVEAGAVMAVLRWAPAEGDALRAFVGLSGLTVAAAVMGSNARSRQALLHSLQERAVRLEAERDQQGRLAAAAERARIAREMHDIVAHNVSVMIALADGAGYATRRDPDRAQAAMRSASETGRQALSEMRRLLGVLREEDDTDRVRTPQPGLAQLDALVEQVRAAGLAVEYEVSGAAGAPLTAGLQLAAYRIAQEALTNAMKHAGPAARARLVVRHDAAALIVEITDTGDPAVEPVAEPAPGAGLRGMRERAAVYDAQLEAGPLPAGGWQVRLTVPVTAPLVPA
jgi:signal transduction histidine kinase